MDAIEFLKAKNRMCRCYAECDDCPISQYGTFCSGIYLHSEEVVAKVEEWLKANPPKTIADKIEELTETKIKIDSDDCEFYVSLETGNDTIFGIAKLKEWLESEYMEK